MFTLFVVPGHPIDDNIDGCVKSWGDIPSKIEIADRRVIPTSLLPKGGWYGWIHANELINEDLREAIPKYLQMPDIDCLIFYKRTFDWLRAQERLFHTPRVFRAHISLMPETLYPESSLGLHFEKVGDGWIDNAPSRSIPYTRPKQVRSGIFGSG